MAQRVTLPVESGSSLAVAAGPRYGEAWGETSGGIGPWTVTVIVLGIVAVLVLVGAVILLVRRTRTR